MSVEGHETMELICPSCEARYRVPDGTIGERGRRVSCTNCGHRWHAYPPAAGAPAAGGLPGEEAGPRADATAGSRSDAVPDADMTASRADEGSGDATIAAGAQPRPTDPARSAQLAELRAMLDEVQEPRPEPAAGQEETPMPAAAATAGPRAEAELDEVPPAAPPRAAEAGPDGRGALPMIDDLAEERVPEHAPTAGQRMAKRESHTSRGDDDIARLRRMQDESAHRVRRKNGGSGAFLTGFLLVVIIGGVMAALYLLAPQIVARFPEAEAMMSEYVAAIDEMRLAGADAYESARAWVLEMMGREPGATPEPAATPEPEPATDPAG